MSIVYSVSQAFSNNKHKNHMCTDVFCMSNSNKVRAKRTSHHITSREMSFFLGLQTWESVWAKCKPIGISCCQDKRADYFFYFYSISPLSLVYSTLIYSIIFYYLALYSTSIPLHSTLLLLYLYSTPLFCFFYSCKLYSSFIVLYTTRPLFVLHSIPTPTLLPSLLHFTPLYSIALLLLCSNFTSTLNFSNLLYSNKFLL